MTEKTIKGQVIIDFTINGDEEISSKLGLKLEGPSTLIIEVAQKQDLVDKVLYRVTQDALQGLVKDRDNRMSPYNLSLKPIFEITNQLNNA